MLPAAPLPIPNPALAQQPVQVLLAHLAAALPWLSNAYGLVQTGVEPNTKNKLPVLYQQDGGALSQYVYPDQDAKAVAWFERDGPVSIEWVDGLHLSGRMSYPLAAVVWLNLPAIDPNRGYDFSDELAQDFLARGLLASPLGAQLIPEAIEQRQERVFARYAWPVERQQLCLWPYAAFRLPFTVRQPYVAGCLPFATS